MRFPPKPREPASHCARPRATRRSPAPVRPHILGAQFPPGPRSASGPEALSQAMRNPWSDGEMPAERDEPACSSLGRRVPGPLHPPQRRSGRPPASVSLINRSAWRS